MSLETWKSEFYPIDADKVEAEDAISHSLNKWIGLQPENLAKHDVRASLYDGITDGSDRMYVGGDACALCFHHYDQDWCDDDDEDADPCGECPLKMARGGVPCDKVREDEVRSPWSEWNNDKKPGLMIHWLEETKAQFTLTINSPLTKENESA